MSLHNHTQVLLKKNIEKIIQYKKSIFKNYENGYANSCQLISGFWILNHFQNEIIQFLRYDLAERDKKVWQGFL